jgi:hypothetical protein
MRIALAVGTVLALLVGSGSARGEVIEQYNDRFMQDMKETVYATNDHMRFSMRASVIRWLGGVPIADQREVRTSEREGWWGEGVPHLPPDAVPRTAR